jgi:hypothetical protein
MATFRLLYVAWRDGRPRFSPGARERDLGFAGEDLRHPDGRWFTLQEAQAWLYGPGGSLENVTGGRYAEILAARSAGKRVKPAAATRARTVETLLEDFIAAMRRGEPGPKGNPLTPAAIESYEKAIEAIIYKPMTRGALKDLRAKERAAELLSVPAPAREKEPFATSNIDAIGKVELNDFYLYAKDERGHHMALAMVAAFSAAYTWGGTARAWRLGRNPRHELTFARPEGRIVVHEADEIAALIAAADAIGRFSIGDAILLGVDTGQRQADRLLLVDEGLFDGRRRFRQSKTGAVVEIKETRRLSQRLAEAKARTAALKLKLGTRDNTVVLNERTGLPYDGTTYRHAFAEVRELAWRGSSALGLAPCPSLQFTDERTGELDFKNDQDLRDTCVTRLYRAGCSPLEICDITGHSYAAVQTIKRHYLGRDRARADAAIDKLEAWMAKEAAL